MGARPEEFEEARCPVCGAPVIEARDVGWRKMLVDRETVGLGEYSLHVPHPDLGPLAVALRSTSVICAVSELTLTGIEDREAVGLWEYDRHNCLQYSVRSQ